MADRLTPWQRFKRDWITHFVLITNDGKWIGLVDPDRVRETVDACARTGKGLVKRVDWIRTFYE